MIIGIDGNEANVEIRVGIGEYAYQVLRHLSESRVQSLEFRVYLKNEPRSDMPKESEQWQYRIVKPEKLWTQIGLPYDLFVHRPRPAVFFTPTHYAPRFSPVPTVISVMDLSYIYYPQLFNKKDLYQLEQWTKYSVKNAKMILTISEASKRDIMEIYGIAKERIVVTHPGLKEAHSHKSIPMDLLNKTYSISGKYILFVGTLQPRKNIERLIEAFSQITSSHTDLFLVIVGKHGWQYESILAAPKKYHVEQRVKFVSFVPDEDLGAFYTNAMCFVLPSLYEGFGLPVLEAMSYNCPVIISNISSLPEAGGDAALYVNPKDTRDIAKKISMVLNDEKLRERMIEKGKKQVQKFSWKKTAKETLQVLETVAGRNYAG